MPIFSLQLIKTASLRQDRTPEWQGHHLLEMDDRKKAYWRVLLKIGNDQKM